MCLAVNIMLAVNIENSFGPSYPVFEINNTAGKVNLIWLTAAVTALKASLLTTPPAKRNATKGADVLLTISCENIRIRPHM